MEDHTLSFDEEIKNTEMRRSHVVILGAGASIAAFPNGDRNGKKLPIMNNLIETLSLESEIEKSGISFVGKNFEDVYSDLSEDPKHENLAEQIEQKVRQYFGELRLPDNPTIYDHLVLSLREKDLIASFNWDPLLYQACWRNHKKMKLPHVVYLHGNVMVGYCMKDQTKGMIGMKCNKCNEPYKPSKLLLPVRHKNYTTISYLQKEWNCLRDYIKNAFIITIFGYSAPITDSEAVDLMKDAWGRVEEKNIEEFEIIDIKSPEELRQTWDAFIHTHHYRTSNNFYESWIAKHPRRTCETMWYELMECRFLKNNSIPTNIGFPEIWDWYDKFKPYET